MKKMLITGGTVFVSRYAAQYFAEKYDVYVINRNTRPQCDGVTLIESDRHDLRNKLRGFHFDVILDITAYDEEDVKALLNAADSFDDYIFVSSSAVYPEYEVQPFAEEILPAENKFWRKYGTDKIAAEKALLSRVPNAYIIRPPYLYGPMNNVYREAFVFECAQQGRPFYLPGNGDMKLQFFHVEDLCRFIEILLEKHPKRNIFNVGNLEPITIREWVMMCYEAVGQTPAFITVGKDIEQRNYFPFYAYEYILNVGKQADLMPFTKPLQEGLREAFKWYAYNKEKVIRKPLIEYIDQHLK